MGNDNNSELRTRENFLLEEEKALCPTFANQMPMHLQKL
jgi:hypothetical protein